MFVDYSPFGELLRDHLDLVAKYHRATQDAALAEHELAATREAERARVRVLDERLFAECGTTVRQADLIDSLRNRIIELEDEVQGLRDLEDEVQGLRGLEDEVQGLRDLENRTTIHIDHLEVLL